MQQVHLQDSGSIAVVLLVGSKSVGLRSTFRYRVFASVALGSLVTFIPGKDRGCGYIMLPSKEVLAYTTWQANHNRHTQYELPILHTQNLRF